MVPLYSQRRGVLFLPALHSVVEMVWTIEQRVYAVSRFLVNGESIVQTQRDFRRQYGIHNRGVIPNRNLILRWVNNFKETGSVMKKKRGEQLEQRERQRMLSASGCLPSRAPTVPFGFVQPI